MVLVVGHRGAKGYEPENTLASFERAIALGADAIELDIHLTKDNVPIVLHDATLNRTTNGRGRVCGKTLAEVRRCHTWRKGQQVPTLEEVIDRFAKRTLLNIEIKGVRPTEAVLSLIGQKGIAGRVIISSNSVRNLQMAKERIPSIRTALLYYATKGPARQVLFDSLSLFLFSLTKRIVLARARAAKADYVHVAYPLISRRFVQELHKEGFLVTVWVLNQRPIIRRVAAMGVAGIISEYPDRVRKVQ